MGKTQRQIKEALPDVENKEVDSLAEQLDKILAIKSLFKSEGGKVLIGYLRDNCSVAIRKATIAAKSGDDTVPYLLDYSAYMDLLTTIQDISMEAEIEEQLEKVVKEITDTM